MAVVPAEIKKYNDGSRIDRRNDNMKKWILALVMVCLCLTGCSGRTGAMRHQSPEAAAESMMQSLKSLDLEAFNDCTDNLVRFSKRKTV